MTSKAVEMVVMERSMVVFKMVMKWPPAIAVKAMTEMAMMMNEMVMGKRL